MTFWQTFGQIQREVRKGVGYTGWYRYVGGRCADGRWPEYHSEYGTRG